MNPQNLIQQLRTFYEGLDSGRRRQLIGALTAAVLGVVAVGYWASQIPWEPLITNRSAEELGLAAQALESEGVNYRIDPVRGAIEVPGYQAGQAHAALAGSNVAPGLKDVEDLKLGLTPEAQQWAFLRAQQGDLARMINGIDGIAASVVSVVPRKEALFLDEEVPASASVFLRLRPGVALGAGPVQSIVNLVATAVPSLSPDRVTVVDGAGKLLAEGTGRPDKALGEASELLAYRAELESRYERAVSQALFPVLGYENHFSITANVELDLTSGETVTKRMDSTKQATLSENLEESSSQKTAPAAVPGVDANLPERAAVPEGDSQNTQSTAITTNYVYPTVDEVSRRPAGGIRRISVAVQVDSATVAALAKAGDTTPEALKEQLAQTVQAAVGFTEERGDLISVSTLPFTDAKWVEGEVTASPAISVQQAAPYAVAALALILLFWFVVRPVIGAATRDPVSVSAEVPDEDSLEPEPAKAVPSAEEKQAEEDARLASRLRLLVDNYEPVDASDLNRLVIRESVAAAQVLRNWHRNI